MYVLPLIRSELQIDLGRRAQKSLKLAYQGLPSHSPASLRAIFKILVGLSLLSACEGVHLYDEGQDTLATGIKTQYEQKAPEAVLATHKTNLEMLAQAEREVSAGGIMFKRDVVFWHLVNGRRTGDFEESDLSNTMTLGQQILADFNETCVLDAAIPCASYATRRLRDLGIKSSDELKQSVDSLTIIGANMGSGSLVDEPGTLLLQQEQNDRDRAALQNFGWDEVWDCKRALTSTTDEAAAAAGVDEGSRTAFDIIFTTYQDDCAAYEDAAKVPAIYRNVGKLGEAYGLWVEDQSQLKELNDARKRTLDDIKAIKIDPDGDDETADKSFVQAAQAKAEEIAKLLNEVQGAEDIMKKLGLEQAIAESRLDELGLLLSVVHAGSLDGLSQTELATLKKEPNFRRAAVLAAGLPGLGNNVERLLDLLNKPAARTDLLIQFAYQKARLGYLKKRADLVEERAMLRQELLRSYLREAFLLYRAQQFGEDPSVKNQTLDAILKGSDALAKERAYQAVIAFDHSISVARKRSAEISSDLANFESRERLLADEYGIETWRALLTGPIGQLQAYYKTGVKSEAIAEALTGLAGLGLLGFIAVESD